MILSRYLMRDIVNTFLALMMLLLLVFLSQQVVRYLNYVAVGKISTNLLLTLVSFEVPYLAALLLPLALYLGILIALGKLYANREMTIMALSGYQKKYLYSLVMLLALVASGVVLVLMLWVNPIISMKREQLMEGEGATSHLINTLMPGRFQVSADGEEVIYAEQLSRDHLHAKNIFIAKMAPLVEDSQHNLPRWMLMRASEGHQVLDRASSLMFFLTTDGYRYEGVPGQNDYQIVQFKHYALRIPPAVSHAVHLADETLTATALWQDYFLPKRAAELQWRFSIGLSTLLLALLALPLSAYQSTRGRYVILLPAALVYIIYINLLFVARHWVEHGEISIAIGMWWVHAVILLCAGLIMLLWKFRSMIGVRRDHLA